MAEPGGAELVVPSLLEEARRRTGLFDAGEDGFSDTLERYVQSCHATGELNETGKHVLPKVLVRHLANRLYLQDHLRRHPQLATSRAAVSLVITGLPRTGTTLLHNLLALDPNHRVLRLWEALHPLPPAAEGRFSRPALLAQARTWLERLYELAPAFRLIHEARPEGPEECDALFQNDFASQHLEDMVEVEAYSRWLDRARLRREYASFSRQLAVLTGPGDGSWVLKSPSHLGHLDDLVEAFPHALVVHCHRHPVPAIASHASLVATVRQPYTDRMVPAAIGRHVLRRGEASMSRALQVRTAMAPGAVVDIAYAELRRQPLAVVATLYDRLGRTLEQATTNAMRGWLADNPQHKHGPHRYELANFGLDTATVEKSFASYMAHFGWAIGE